MLPYCDNLQAIVRRTLLKESQMTDTYTYSTLTSCFHPMNDVIRRDLIPQTVSHALYIVPSQVLYNLMMAG